jgi:hypothetical protein
MPMQGYSTLFHPTTGHARRGRDTHRDYDAKLCKLWPADCAQAGLGLERAPIQHSQGTYRQSLQDRP